MRLSVPEFATVAVCVGTLPISVGMFTFIIIKGQTMYIEKYTHSYEHKGALDDINVSLILDCGFSDVSWHNDAMPSFVNADESIRVWCDYADPDEREFQQLF